MCSIYSVLKESHPFKNNTVFNSKYFLIAGINGIFSFLRCKFFNLSSFGVLEDEIS